MLDSERSYIAAAIEKHEHAARKAYREFISSGNVSLYMVFRLEQNSADVLENLLCEIGGDQSEDTEDVAAFTACNSCVGAAEGDIAGVDRDRHR